MAYKVESPLQTFFGTNGQILAGGYLKFFAADTVTPKAVYADKALVTTNGATVALDASGRTNVACWGSGDYYIEVYDANNVKQAQDTATDPAGAALNIPIPNTGEFLTGDGAQILKQLLRQLPDPTGHAGQQLGTDGSALIWEAKQAIPPSGVSSTAGKITIGTNIIQFGSDTFPAPSVSPPHGAAKVVTFPTPFTTCGGVIVCSNKNSIATYDYKAACAAEYTNSGFTATYNINEAVVDPTSAVTVTIPFSWIAWGA